MADIRCPNCGEVIDEDPDADKDYYSDYDCDSCIEADEWEEDEDDVE